MNEKQIKLVRAALLLAIALLAQQLRLVLPLPKFLDTLLIGTLLIGTLVNASHVLTAHYTSLFLAAITTAALPIVAFLQGHLPIALLIPVVFAGNFLFVLLCYFIRNRSVYLIAPLLKTLAIYGGALFMLKFLGLPAAKIEAIVLALSWPQLFTGILGIILAKVIEKRLAYF